MHDMKAWLEHEEFQKQAVLNLKGDKGLTRLQETDRQSLNQYFFLHTNGTCFLGRRFLPSKETVSKYFSLIEPEMLLGRFQDFTYGDQTVDFYFLPCTLQEAREIFSSAASDKTSEIVFPFPVLDNQLKEMVCPDEYWSEASQNAEKYAQEEVHFVNACSSLLQRRFFQTARVFDPACSTGDFIAALSGSLSHMAFIGADKSPAMIAKARNRHPDRNITFLVSDADAHDGMMCDVLILRFLNSEVVLRSDAEHHLQRLLRYVQPGGIIILFGHTPVLAPVKWLCDQLQLKFVSALDSTRDGRLFQFYVIEKP